MAEKIRILMIDDHPLVLEGVPLLLREFPDLEVVATTDNPWEGMKLLTSLRPDVIVIDLTMPGIGGLEAISQILRARPEVRVVVFSGHDGETTVLQALGAGALGYVTKGSRISLLAAAVRHAFRGEYWLSDRVRTSFIDSLLKNEPKPAAALDSLSLRERETFSLLARGKSTDEVAGLLSISPKTVGKHRVSIKQKLKLRNSAEIVLYAASHGLLDPVEPAPEGQIRPDGRTPEPEPARHRNLSPLRIHHLPTGT